MRPTRELDENDVSARIEQRLRRASRGALYGRERELERLDEQLGAEGAIVTFVHGMGGIGKTSLLAELEPRLQARGARVLRLDGRSVEPTAAGFLRALGHVLDRGELDVDALARMLEEDARASVFLIDEFDHLRLLDDWLRHTLLPRLPERTRWIVAGRFAPRSAWLTTPGWSQSVLALELKALDDGAACALLSARGVPRAAHGALLDLTGGTPLALTLVAAQAERAELGAINASLVLSALAQRSVAALPGPLREALEAAALVRRTTRGVLEAMLGRPCDDTLLDELAELSFVEPSPDGLVLHETVRHALEARLSALDPERHRRLRRAAWRALERGLHESSPSGPQAWRLTSDLLFLLEHADIREAFFPTRDPELSMDVALPGDEATLRAIVQRHEGPAWLVRFDAWWNLARWGVRVARDGSGRAQGFALVAASSALPPELARADPLLERWRADLAASPGRERGALFMRRALSAEHGEALSAERSAIWLDIKRAYVERPSQWAIYTATRQADAFLPLVARLGFVRTALTYEGDETLRLELGGGIWDWLRGLMNAGEAGHGDARPPWYLDEATRALVRDGVTEPLSALEYRALGYLLEQRERVVSRNELLDAVWQQRHTGSNVVDAVMRLLRKKLGPHAAALETVRGHGYRIVRPRSEHSS